MLPTGDSKGHGASTGVGGGPVAGALTIALSHSCSLLPRSLPVWPVLSMSQPRVFSTQSLELRPGERAALDRGGPNWGMEQPLLLSTSPSTNRGQPWGGLCIL